jgi:hypothetical protein
MLCSDCCTLTCDSSCCGGWFLLLLALVAEVVWVLTSLRFCVLVWDDVQRVQCQSTAF